MPPRLYNLNYQQDIKEYGDPARTNYQTVEFNANNTTWQAVIRRHSKNVKPNPKNAQLLAAAEAEGAESSTSRKRARTEMEGGGEDGGEGSGAADDNS